MLNVFRYHFLVAPLVGAWIERTELENYHIIQVAPLVGAWIERSSTSLEVLGVFVAPLVGAWIESRLGTSYNVIGSSRSSCRSVD